MLASIKHFKTFIQIRLVDSGTKRIKGELEVKLSETFIKGSK